MRWAWLVVLVSGVGFARDAFLSRRGEWPAPVAARGVVTAHEARLGVPTFFWAEPVTRAATPRAQGLSATEAARGHLLVHASLYRLPASTVAAAALTGLHDTGQGAIIATFAQRVREFPVLRDAVHVVMTRELELVAISGYLTPQRAPRGDFRLTAEAAAAVAWANATGQLRDLPPSDARDEGGYVTWPSPAGFVRARQAWFPLVEGLAPAFHVEVEWRDGARAVVVAADTGEVLFDKSNVAHHSYTAWADPATLAPWPNPWGPGALPAATAPTWPFVAPSRISLLHAGLSTNDPWLSPGATTLRGNNVAAYVDRSWPDGFTQGDLDGATSAPGEFHWDFVPTVSASTNDTQKQVGLSHLFYVTNYLHDWLYDVGFDERGGNAQASNFARGGVGGDAMLAEGLDSSGRNNANMLTPSDGRSPRMQMYLWTPTSPPRDSSLDTTIVAHEYGHYVTNRLIGDALGIANNQAYGMGEGWSDFLAMLLLTSADDASAPGNAAWGGRFPVAAYADNEWQYGIRRAPMSVDFNTNALTFLHVQWGTALPPPPFRPNSFPNSYVHNTGEVWAVMLWEGYVGLLRDPRHSFAQAQDRMKRYLIAALKATPMAPTFVEARDALLAVAVANDADDYQTLWRGFARRGIGAGAVAPERYDDNNRWVTESYLLQSSVRVVSMTVTEHSGGCDADGVLDADEDGVVRLTVRNLGLQTLAAGASTLTLSAPLGGLLFPLGDRVDLPALGPSALHTLELPVRVEHLLGPQSLQLQATVTGETLFPASASTVLPLLVNHDVRLASSARDDFESGASVWTSGVDSTLDITGEFRVVSPVPTQHYWSAAPGGSTADVWLTSPPLTVGQGPLTMRFLHRYEFERAGATLYDGAVIEASVDDGRTWVDVGDALRPGYIGTLSTTDTANPLAGRRALAGRSAAFPAFESAALELDTRFAGQTVRLRFRVGSDETRRLPSRGWELDDVEFTGLVDTPFPRRDPDPNRCSNTPPVVTTPRSLRVKEGTRVELLSTAIDVDGDALVVSWAQTSGPGGALNGNVFIAPEVLVDATLTLEVTAHDGRSASAPVVVTVTVENVNRAPTVSLPATRAVQPGETVTIEASARDVDGDPLTYAWTQREGPPVQLDAVVAGRVTFTAPVADTAQTLTLEVVVRDDKGASASSQVEVRVAAAPVATPPPEAPPMKGCGCSSGGGLAAAWALLLMRRRFRSTRARV